MTLTVTLPNGPARPKPANQSSGSIPEGVHITFPSLRHPPATLVGSDGKRRPAWVGTDPVLLDYYDTEWGVPLTDEDDLFEILCLLVFQAGLRWKTILTRRTVLRAAFGGFSPDLLASWGQEDIERLMCDTAVIRNRRKIESTLTNARATVRLRNEGGLASLVWSHQPDTSPPPLHHDDLPPSIPESEDLANDLRNHGFAAVGPKSCYALMQAAGIVDTNPLEAYRRGDSGLWQPDGRRRATRTQAA
ncbi:DNA-3-methyladenine glycosylase I [Actinomycetaceae bacterium MB13-C1-2]|nr:DNA-3-methyladenine glycosylase I [Actinomycetaceae bacterium MB13-C1-2]